MIELLIQSSHLDLMLQSALDTAQEGCAVLLTRAAARKVDSPRLISWDLVLPDPSSYLERGEFEAVLSPEFVAGVTKRARQEGCGLVFIHSHPGGDPPYFSMIDDDGEQHLANFLQRRIPLAVHVAMVVSKGGITARILGSKKLVRVIEVGIKRRNLFDGDGTVTRSTQVEYDRQVRAFGVEGQNKLGQLQIGIVGLGGTGSVVAQQLAHLGIRRFLLIDPDIIEPSNLNRLANATPSDIGLSKVEVAKRHINAVSPGAQVEALIGDIINAKVARGLAEVDLLFGCTDSHGSRAVLQQIAYQYLVPCIDLGSTIVASKGSVTHILGRVQMLTPGRPCLTCTGLLDPNEVRRDMMTAFERQSDPYIVGVHEPAPAVMSLNSTVASLAVTMFLDVVTDLAGDARHLLYNAITSSLRVIEAKAHPTCFICSTDGVLGRGDDAPLMARQG